MLKFNVDELNEISLLEAALRYAEAGFPVFPCNEDKSPRTSNGFKAASIDRQQILAWWEKWPSAPIGVPTGEASGIFALDLDLPSGPQDLDELEARHGYLPETAVQRTGSGGKHILFLYPEGRRIKSRVKINGTCIDVRGEGGYIIVPPSRNLKGGYMWVDSAILAESPSWLMDWLDQGGGNQKTNRNKRVKANAISSYAETALNNELDKVRQAPEGTRNVILNKAAFALGQLVGTGLLDQSLVESSLLNATSLLEAEALRTIRSGVNSGVKEPRKNTAKDASNTSGSAAATDYSTFMRGEIHPVTFDTMSPPPIPQAIIPEPLRTFCTAAAESIQVPLELVLCNVLGVLAVVCQRMFKVQVAPGYIEPVNVYCLCALQPGERKSAIVELCKRVLLEWQKLGRLEIEEQIQYATTERKALEKAIDYRRTKFASAKNAEEREVFLNEIRELEKELPEVPVIPRLLADDFTPEALAVIMEQQGQRIGLLEAEGGIFDTLAGRYSGGVPNIDAILKFWSCEGVSIDRKGKETIYLEDPALTLCLSPQPDVVKGLAEKPGFKGRGLLGRFLYFMPKSRLGNRVVNPPQMPAAVRTAYDSMISNLLTLPWATDEYDKEIPYLLHLDKVATAQREDFADMVEKEFRPGGELEYMTEWGGKLPGAAVRIAALLHLSQHTQPQQHNINGDTMKAALEIAAILVEHAKAAFSLMGTNPDHECAKAILEWITSHRLMEFSGRDCLRKLRGRFHTMKQINAGLNVLVERAYLLHKEPNANGPGRKPSNVYLVNPLVLGA